ncbi:MAG TPA: hypothetical protein VFQ44_01960 [Streptosporangiaceae bacterium]|nr:hypothetical protein [Streptosporangiaceae bacterium]
MPTSDVVARETAWLQAAGDGLPALRKADGGPWDIVQAYWPGNRLATKKSGIYVTRGAFDFDHVNAQRYRPQHTLVLVLWWPVRTSTALIAEQEQQAFDDAIELLVERIAGPVGDKTHGRFLSVGEVPGQVSVAVVFDPPWQTIQSADNNLRATATYHADDFEITG